MEEIIADVAGGRWFREPAPFRCVVQAGHPRLCVITGPNASGKSLLRKVIHNRYADRKWAYVHISQEGRITSSGLKRLWVYGAEADESTGYNSVKALLKMFESCRQYADPFGVMLDEPEIGCGEEVQAAVGLRVARDLDTLTNLHAMYVVTHSRELARRLLPLRPTHWRLGGDDMTLERFVGRPVVPADLEAVLEAGRAGWRAVNRVTKNL